MAVSDFALLKKIGTSIATNQEVFKIRAENMVEKDVSGYKAKIPVLISSDDEFRGEIHRASSRYGRRRRASNSKESGMPKSGGVFIKKLIEDQTPCEREYDPENPEADEDGYIVWSNVNPTREILAMTDAESAVSMNIEVEKAILRMIRQDLSIANARE
ncbi:hypothetical protein FACS1894198_2090 [Clostridia bacterium]|nr:hypothetical protein FACS1894198_2090 [Clostridia bacterium]